MESGAMNGYLTWSEIFYHVCDYYELPKLPLAYKTRRIQKWYPQSKGKPELLITSFLNVGTLQWPSNSQVLFNPVKMYKRRKGAREAKTMRVQAPYRGR